MYKRLLTISILSFLICGLSFAEDKKDYIKIGGAVRFNAGFTNYETKSNALDTYAKFDTWMLDVNSSMKGFDLSAQYRLYPDAKLHFLHHAYVGYGINSDFYAKLGVFQKPFGLAGDASNSWFLQLPYTIGLEDSYSIGIGATYKYHDFVFDLAYFRQAGPKGYMKDKGDTSVGNSRYSYAIVQSEGADIRELDQFNARIRYQVNEALEVGLSGQLGGIYNKVTENRKWAFAGAAHVELKLNRWNVKSEVIGYNYNARNDNGKKMSTVTMGGYGASYDVAARGIVYDISVAYNIPINKKFIQNIKTYVDYSAVQKNKKSFYATHQLVPGVMLTSGPIFTYLDCAIAKNQPSITATNTEGLGRGLKDGRWNVRLNLNVGYYF